MEATGATGEASGARKDEPPSEPESGSDADDELTDSPEYVQDCSAAGEGCQGLQKWKCAESYSQQESSCLLGTVGRI